MEEVRLDKAATKFSFENNIFDIIRYYAMLQVMVNHIADHFKLRLPTVLQALIKFQGVVILFALSGYLTAASLDRDSKDGEVNKHKFLKKRFFRIFPEYWLCVLINTIVIFILYSTKPSLKEGLIYVITQFGCLNFYTGEWLRGYGVGAPNGSLWTILVELEFYVIILFIWKWLKNKGIITWSILLAIFAGMNYLSAVIGDSESVVHKLINCNVIPFMYMFMIGAFIYRFREKIFNFDRKILITATLILFCLYSLGMNIQIAGIYLPLLSGISLAAISIILGYLFNRKIRAKVDITYGTYLYHMVVVNAIITFGIKQDYAALIVVILISLLLGIISLYFNKIFARLSVIEKV